MSAPSGISPFGTLRSSGRTSFEDTLLSARSSRSYSSLDKTPLELISDMFAGHPQVELSIAESKEFCRLIHGQPFLEALRSVAEKAGQFKLSFHVWNNLLTNPHHEHPRELFELKKALFDKIPKTKRQKVTYTAIIYIAGKNGEFPLARAAFEEAKERRIADSVTFHAFVSAAARNNEMSLAEEAFEQAKKLMIADAAMYHIMVDVYYRANPARAQAFFSDYAPLFLQRFVKREKESGIDVVDLHDFSHWSGMFTILEEVKDPRRDSFIVVCGQGKAEDGNRLAFRTMLLEQIRRQIPNWDVIDLHNDGRFRLDRRCSRLMNYIRL